MNNVENIEQEIQQLTPTELAALRKWFLDFGAVVWDKHIENDARAGRFDASAEAAREAFKAGKCSEL